MLALRPWLLSCSHYSIDEPRSNEPNLEASGHYSFELEEPQGIGCKPASLQIAKMIMGSCLGGSVDILYLPPFNVLRLFCESCYYCKLVGFSLSAVQSGFSLSAVQSGRGSVPFHSKGGVMLQT